MKNSKVLKGYLAISGLLLIFIGGSTLFMPEAMKGSAGIDLGGNISILNDVRAASALLLAIGLTTAVGAFSPKLRYTSSFVSFITFLSLGAGRLISITSDGMPVDGLVKATGLEIVLGLLGVILFMVNQEK